MRLFNCPSPGRPVLARQRAPVCSLVVNPLAAISKGVVTTAIRPGAQARLELAVQGGPGRGWLPSTCTEQFDEVKNRGVYDHKMVAFAYEFTCARSPPAWVRPLLYRRGELPMIFLKVVLKAASDS